MTVLAVIPARGGSKGIPRKNIKLLAGRPLIEYSIRAALESKMVDRVIVTTDDEEIMRVAAESGAEVPFRRPAELAKDDTPALPVIKHAVRHMEQAQGYRPDYIVLLQPTSPLRTSHHVDEALKALVASDADSLVSVIEVPHQFSPFSIMEFDGRLLRPYLQYSEANNLRQLKPKFYARNGAAIYAFSRTCLLEKGSIYGEKILPYFMARDVSWDIDEPLDWEIAEIIMAARLGDAVSKGKREE